MAALAAVFPTHAYAQFGDIDTSFGAGGASLTPTTGWRVLAEGPERSIVAAKTTSSQVIVGRYLSTGKPDTSWGSNGTVNIPISGIGLRINQMIVQPDAKVLLVVAHFQDGGRNAPTLIRLLPNGTLDSTFGQGGMVTSMKRSTSARDWSGAEVQVLVQPDGRLAVVTGVQDEASTVAPETPESLSNLATVMLSSNGTVDASWGSDGWSILPVGPTTPELMVVDARGVTALGRSIGSPDWQLVRTRTDGTLDSVFGVNGQSPWPWDRSDAFGLYATTSFAGGRMFSDGQGRILTANGTPIALPGTNGAINVHRLLPTGQSDAGFGTAGTTALPQSNEVTRTTVGGITGTADGASYVIGGQLRTLTTVEALAGIGPNVASEIVFAKLRSDGVLDPGYHGDGTHVIAGETLSIGAPITMSDGKVVAPITTGSGDAASGVARFCGTASCSGIDPAEWHRRNAGTFASDSLRGSAVANTMDAGRGHDRIQGLAGNDTLIGGFGSDLIEGGAGNDILSGGESSDRLLGGAGADLLRGSAGADQFVPGPGRDRVVAGPGNDTINSRDGKPGDIIDCGPGKDVATIDRGDVVRHCERVLRPKVKRSSH